MKATYNKHHYPDKPQGHIYLDKDGPCTITLLGAVSMTQEELDFYGKHIAAALSKITRGQVKHFGVRKYWG